MMYASTLLIFVLWILFFAQNRSFDKVGTYVMIRNDKLSNKVVAIVCRRFKTNDAAVLLEGYESKPSALRDRGHEKY